MKKSLNSNRIILGITAFNHDSSACILKDDKLVAFAEEERFNGLKHTNTFPSQAIKYCLSEAGIQSKDVTDIAFYFNVRECWSSYFKTNNFFNYLADPSLFLRKRYIYELLWLLDFSLKVKTIPKLLMNNKVRVHYVNHHMAHTWYGFYASNVDEAVVVSNDSVGESTSTLVSQFKRDANGYIHSNVLTSQKDPNSLGYLYGAITDYLGFKRGEGEGRVMALASFGRPRYQAFFLDRIDLLPKGKFKIQKSLLQQRSFQPRGRRLSKLFYNTFGRARVADTQLTQKHYDLALGIQNALETVGMHQLQYATKFSNNIILTGGVAQNSVFNGKAANIFRDVTFHVPPIPHDAGCSIGAAVFVYNSIHERLPRYTDTAFLGPSYSDEKIIGILENSQIKYRILEKPSHFIATELNKGRVIACFRGRMECGPRALCNRSILASPISTSMRRRLNDQVKFREAFRPYGGFTRGKYVKIFLDAENASKSASYMNFVYPVKDDWREKIPALNHIDNTCRIQTVYENDPFLVDLIDQFYKKTGVPLIINTSLNVRGKPIARTPEDAIHTYSTSDIDYLILNEHILVSK